MSTSITYHPSGGVLSYSSSNGITTTIGYDDNRHWVRNITSGALQLAYSTYDNVGNPRTIGGLAGRELSRQFADLRLRSTA